MSLEKTDVSTCSHYGEQPCIWFAYEDNIKENMMEWYALETWKECYKCCIRMRYGYLGKGKRVEIPACVLARVRKIYPDEEEDYMGFKAK
jgi:hypothetical protein